MKVRIKFRKFGIVRFIGHLDVMRFFQKAIRRAEIDIAYTAGFNPHQVMSFAAPLGVGLESNGEYMDIELQSLESSKSLVDRLNAVCVEGIEILSAKVLPEDAGNAMASVAAASYTIRFREGREPNFTYLDKLEHFFASPQILIQKTTKRSTLEIDLKAGIYELYAKEGNIYMLVDASSSGNIKPSAVIEAFMSANETQLQENSYTITREDTFSNAGTAEAPIFFPLDDIGREI